MNWFLELFWRTKILNVIHSVRNAECNTTAVRFLRVCSCNGHCRPTVSSQHLFQIKCTYSTACVHVLYRMRHWLVCHIFRYSPYIRCFLPAWIVSCFTAYYTVCLRITSGFLCHTRFYLSPMVRIWYRLLVRTHHFMCGAFKIHKMESSRCKILWVGWKVWLI